MTKNVIEEFKQKHNNFNFEEFIEDYLKGDSRETLCSNWNITELPLRMFMKNIGLEWVKSKRYSSFEEFKYRVGLEDNISDVKLIKELEKDVEILSEKNRKLYQSLTLVRDENTVLRKESRQEARQGDLYEHLIEAFKSKIDSMSFPPIKLEQDLLDYEVPEEGLCGLFSDIHSGDYVNSEVTPFNNYNYEVMEKRMIKVAEEIIWYPHQSKTLTMFHLLDDIKGLLHGGLYTSLDGVTTSMLKIVESYAKVYELLVQHYSNINIYVTNSNHDRKTEKPTSSDKWDNFGIMLAKFLEMILKAKGYNNINFQYTKHDYQLVKINGANILAFHGDAQRSFKPYSATEISKAQDICLGMFNTTFKHTVNGHFHIGNVCANQYGGVGISNGTLVGNTEYGTTNGFRSIIPSQTIFFVNEEGNIEDTKLINLASII